MHLRLLFVSVFLAAAAPAALPAAAAAKKPVDTVEIDQSSYRIRMIPQPNTSGKTARVIVRLTTAFALRSQAKAFLRAAANLDGPDSFRSVFAKEVGSGPKAQSEDLAFTIDQPKQKIIRVIVWLDQRSATAAPAPLASDNVAFESGAFLNVYDR